MKRLLSIDTNAKTVKGQKKGFLTGILYLAPSDASGVMNTCPHASAGCRSACLYTAGRGAFQNVQNARVEKTLLFARDRDAFMKQISDDIAFLIRTAKSKGLTPCVRLNGTSDIEWENIPVQGEETDEGISLGWGNIMKRFPDVQFYDYTKNVQRAKAYGSGLLPSNYHITFSRAENNAAKVQAALSAGCNVAAVFHDLPETWEGFPVINGDESDLRFTDPRGVIVGLISKGKARKDVSGFVIE